MPMAAAAGPADATAGTGLAGPDRRPPNQRAIRTSDSDQQAARELASELGGLPLTACDGRSHTPPPGTAAG